MREIEPSFDPGQLTELTAISPLDGRYWGDVRDLSPYTAEFPLIKKRMYIEARYLIALSAPDVGLVRPLSDTERDTLASLGPNLTLSQAARVKAIEAETHHDVKAMERVMREILSGTSLVDVVDMIHFSLTSEDVNNLAYRLMLNGARGDVCVPALDEIVDLLCSKADEYKSLPMLARTHGQPAVPTTLGKEFANFAVRLNTQTRKLAGVRLTGKLNGAVGNYSAHVLAAGDVDWVSFSDRFISGLGLEPNLFTTQIPPYEDMIELFQAFCRVNGVLLDFDQDMWRYISDTWFVQEARKGEVGSSTMPQKVNPIRFENSEGNLSLSNAIFEGLARKLAVSRLQRDLSDSTTVRNVGVALGHSLLAYRNTLAGIGRVHPNPEAIHDALHDNWSILSEGVQTVLRRAGVSDPYSLVAGLARGQKIREYEWRDWVDNLPVDEIYKEQFRNLAPDTYLGEAEKLTKLALLHISHSRGGTEYGSC